MIAAGLLACWAARADSVIISVPELGFDNNLPPMYPDRLAAVALASDNLFDISESIGADFGRYSLYAEPLTEAALALPFNLPGGRVTSFSNLSLAAGEYWRVASDPLTPPDFQHSAAALPPDFEVAREARMTSFGEASPPAADYWELLGEPLASPATRTWVAELPPAFEIAREWAEMARGWGSDL